MNAIVIYDIEPKENNKAFRLELRKDNDFFRGWAYNGKKFFLPQFSLYKIDTELSIAKNDFLKLAERYNQKYPDNKVKVVSLLVVPASPWDGIEGEDLGL